MSTTTFETVARIVQEEHHCDPTLIRRDVPLIDLGLDSLALMEFIFSVEDAFHLRLPEDKLDPREAGITLGDLCDAIDARMAEEAAGSAMHPEPARA